MFPGALSLSTWVLCAVLGVQSQDLAAKEHGPEDHGALARVRDFSRELRVREAAADPAGSAQWLTRGLTVTDPQIHWTENVAALDALSRALDARPELAVDFWRDSIATLTTHGHPNVRAAAWRVLAAAGAGTDPAADTITAAGKISGVSPGASTWEERLERAKAMARSGMHVTELRGLSNDADVRVGDLVLAEALQSGSRDESALAEMWLERFDDALARADPNVVMLLSLLELAPEGAGIARRVTEQVAVRAADAPEEWRAIHALCLACLGRQAGALEAQQLDFLAAHWSAAARWHPAVRALMTRAARALGAPLGERLAAQACAPGRSADAIVDCLGGAIEALDGNRLLAIATPLAMVRPDLAEALFNGLRGQVEAWDPQALSPWLAPQVAPAQRARALLIVAETFRQNRDAGSAKILVSGLEDPDDDAAAEAFQGLAGAPDPRPWMLAMHAAWARHSEDWRAERLGDLTRDLPWTPFRADLLEIASQSRTTSARAAELLAPFRGDLEVREALREWLEQDLGRILADSPREGRTELDPRVVSSALSLLRALVAVADQGAEPSMLAALEASRGRSIELGKAAIYLLGRSAEGRRSLAPWMQPKMPSRLRAEAALALAPFPEREAAIQILLTDYRNYDEALRVRALRVFSVAEDSASAARLLEVARSAESGAGEILASIECLGARALREPALARVMLQWLEEDALDTELRTLTIAELFKLNSAEIHGALLKRFEVLQRRERSSADLSRAAQERAFERENLITGFAHMNAVALLDDAVPFELPGERAVDEFAARAAGERRAEVEFTARAELELIAAFARAGRIAGCLEGVTGWRGLDARFLLECAGRVRANSAQSVGGAELYGRLALAAEIGLCGELAVDDTQRLLFEARRLALESARDGGDLGAFAARGARLLHDVRTGKLASQIFARAYGEFDPRRAVDGLGRLACDVRLARARLALADHNPTLAREELARARVAAVHSRAGSEGCAAFELELESSGR